MVCLCLGWINLSQAADVKNAGLEADALEAQAVELIDADKMDQGLAFISKALTLDPSPIRHMNYGSILFGNGVAAFKQGQKEHGNEILRQAESELNQAIKGFDNNKDANFLAQAYFLLGEMYANAFGDKARAKEFYKKAIAVSEHAGAKAALSKLQ